MAKAGHVAFQVSFGITSLSSCQTCGCAQNSCADCQTPADCSNCSSCCCNNAHQSWRRTRIRTGIRVEYFSSAWMIVEAIGSVGFGLFAGSFAPVTRSAETASLNYSLVFGLSAPAEGRKQFRATREKNRIADEFAAFRSRSDDWPRRSLFLHFGSETRGFPPGHSHSFGSGHSNAPSLVGEEEHR